MQSQIQTRAFILNIGLKPSKRFPERADITPEEIRLTLDRVFTGYGIHPYIRSLEIQQSATEKTAVIRLSLDAEADAMEHAAGLWFFIALNLSQDCIAVVAADIVENLPRRLPDQSIDGALAGPYAAYWGGFNPAYFLLPTQSKGDHYAGHLPDSGVQVHSASPEYARHGLVMVCHECGRRKLWTATAKGRDIISGRRHDAVLAAALGLLTGA